MIDLLTAPYGVLLLRVALGIMFFAHAWLKYRRLHDAGNGEVLSVARASGVGRVRNDLRGGGRGEIALILGIYPRIVALLLIPLILGTIVTVHRKNGWLFSNKDGGWEYPAFWALALLAVFLSADGGLVLVPSPILLLKGRGGGCNGSPIRRVPKPPQ